MGEDQLALRTNDPWLPEEKGPTTNEKGRTTNADLSWVIPVIEDEAVFLLMMKMVTWRNFHEVTLNFDGRNNYIKQQGQG